MLIFPLRRPQLGMHNIIVKYLISELIHMKICLKKTILRAFYLQWCTMYLATHVAESHRLFNCSMLVFFVIVIVLSKLYAND